MRYDPNLEGTFRACPVPGDEVMAAYFELERVSRALEAAWFADTSNHEAFRIYCVAQAKCMGFREAVEIYCPSVPGYSNTGGHMLMAADMHFDHADPQPADPAPTGKGE